MATGIMDTEARHSALCATSIAKTMRRPATDMVRKVLCHEATGRTDNSRAQQALRGIGRATATSGVMNGTMRPSSVNAKEVRKMCTAKADHVARERAQSHAHVQESVTLYEEIRPVHGVTALPRTILCGNHLGQMIHQQVRACATRFNAYTSHRGKCTHCGCRDKIETNEHVIAHCPRYAEARAAFNRKTGITLSGETYASVMALDYKRLQVEATTLAKALCAFLAHVARKHAQHNKKDRIASVAHSLGGNQGRSIIPTDVGTLPSERAPAESQRAASERLSQLLPLISALPAALQCIATPAPAVCCAWLASA